MLENPYPPDQRNCCLTCGFLGKRASMAILADRPILAVPWEDRESGDCSGHPLAPMQAIPLATALAPMEFICIRHHDLAKEAAASRQSADSKPWNETYQDLFNQKRHGSLWYPYMSGFTPHDHLAEFRMQQLEEHQAKRDDELFDRNQRTQTKMLEVAQRNLWITLLAVMLTAVGVWFAAKASDSAPVINVVPAPMPTIIVPAPIVNISPVIVIPTIAPLSAP